MEPVLDEALDADAAGVDVRFGREANARFWRKAAFGLERGEGARVESGRWFPAGRQTPPGAESRVSAFAGVSGWGRS
jgi:hypothetical protein